MYNFALAFAHQKYVAAIVLTHIRASLSFFNPFLFLPSSPHISLGIISSRITRETEFQPVKASYMAVLNRGQSMRLK